MFVAPRPLIEDDPLFAVRLAIMPTIGFALGMVLQSPMAMLFPIMMFSLTAGNRKAFDLKRVLGAPIAFAAMLWLMSLPVALLYQTPLALITVMGGIYFFGFYMIQSTGNAMGMLFIVSAALMSVMGLGSFTAMSYLRSEMTKAALCVAIFAPIMYLLLPVKTKEFNVDVYVPSDEYGRVARSLIRAGVMLAFSLYLYTILDFGNVMLGIAGMFILVFSTQGQIWREVGQRSFSAALGGVLSFVVLGALTLSGHLVVLLGLTFLTVLWLAHKMMTGRLATMAYQDAASIMISLIGSALASSDPAFAFIQRAGLTVMGAVIAAAIVSLLDWHFVEKRRPATT
ncbi:Protein of unknown function [Devosia crocina]|uniref:Fusaric acid resistance protein-like n=1 Tax=Devosia crocina TaxID=429728 RepID=A0A1I7NPR7_9HYPH|nr:DUF2955 domain-containing protein [Devosia crocina]SFV36570.1 Protein of unknown function [Devosia crocina]